ncbi:hypothetical protein EIZ62_19115 [Streptomyces ficellus]|uniref:HTH cro/C1-type domain-containing protein n=1 Tax=Streptomyces ficellus TaxID=1977088 RepID=A0A6I6F840_9ACTN|nr:hypothetical protein EIZ62_19115 [Streptomyces ficellus]
MERPNYVRIEQGQSSATLDTLILIADAIGRSLAQLVRRAPALRDAPKGDGWPARSAVRRALPGPRAGQGPRAPAGRNGGGVGQPGRSARLLLRSAIGSQQQAEFTGCTASGGRTEPERGRTRDAASHLAGRRCRRLAPPPARVRRRSARRSACRTAYRTWRS